MKKKTIIQSAEEKDSLLKRKTLENSFKKLFVKNKT